MSAGWGRECGERREKAGGYWAKGARLGYGRELG